MEKDIQVQQIEGERLEGRIIRGVGGFYDVAATDGEIWRCQAKGIFRLQKIRPLAGDFVEIILLDPEEKVANLARILPRKNELLRPAIANVDQALLIFSLKAPDPDSLLLDRFLISMEDQQLPILLCFNKKDLVEEKEQERWKEIYEKAGYEILMISASKESRELLLPYLKGRTTVLAGPSGVGKSTLTNLLQEHTLMETGEISRKLKRGKHTTRRAELIPIDEETWFADTPGFTSLQIPELLPAELSSCFPEMAKYSGKCRFQGCAHMAEPDCAVKKAVEAGEIHPARYANYQSFYRELQDREKKKY